MRIRRRIFFFGTAGLASLGIVRAPARGADFRYKFGHDLPTSHPYDTAAHEFAANVLRESNGRLEIQVFPNNTLGSDPAMFQQLRSGALEMVTQSTEIASFIPVANIALLPFCFNDRRTALAAMEGSVGDIIRRELEARDIVGFRRVWEIGFRQIATNVHPIRTVDDLGGVKLRVPTSAISVEMWKALGASPVPLPVSQLYSALQTHLVDGCDGATTTLLSEKLYEVEKYLSITNHQWTFTWLLINGAAWKALPIDLQAILRQNADAAGLRETRLVSQRNDAATKQLVQRGLQMNVADTRAFRPRLAAYYQRWKAEFGPAAWSALEQFSGNLG
jgi:tripartite ATP-independent transporter DctP family solute receptor